MEVQSDSEVRRIHIVYFLSRKGLTEHPHFIRLHHHSRNGVRLRDVKRWLGELRGKDMPQLFSWSYKRKYKTGHVWQDLLDDDLITPISDNEYVLKGSEVSPTTLNREFSYYEKDQSSLKSETKDFKNLSETSIDISTKSLSEIEEESPTFGSETSTLMDDTTKNGDQEADSKIEDSRTFHSSLLNKKNKRKSDNVKINEKINPISASDSLEPNLNKSKNHNSNAFRNFITCGGIDTNDSALVTINKHNNVRPFMSMCSCDERNVRSAEICKREKLGGSERILGNPNWTQQQWSGRKSCDGVKESMKNKSEFRDQRGLHGAAAKPMNRPKCSQCGKQFKPEKLHSHMKSCKGMKAFSKASISTANTEKPAPRSTEFPNTNSISGHLLTHY